MPVRIVTIGGEHGSGRTEIGRLLAERLGWRLLDSALIAEIAREAHIEPAVARRFDECTDPWLHRLRKALWRGGYEGVVTTAMTDIFDADAMAALAARVIELAARQGECVIVGRGSQCVLQRHADAFHVFIYAPREERIGRLRRESPGQDAETLLETVDRGRQAYIRRHFDHDWMNCHLYNLMLCSSPGEAAVADVIHAALAHHRRPQ
jgi:cytidylate kinase